MRTRKTGTPRKGDITFTEMMGIALLVVGALFLAIIMTGGGEFIAQYFNEFCQKYPTICGSDDNVTVNEIYIARASSNALSCAVDSALAGRGLNCGTYIATNPDTKQNLNEVRVECSFAGGPVISKPGESVGGENKCTVENYWLPQRVEGAEEWIAGYGDPQFLNYYSAFPTGEDKAWTGHSTWLQNAELIVLYAIPFNRLLTIGKTAAIGKLGEISSSLKAGVKEKFQGMLQRLDLKSEDTEFMILQKTGDLGLDRQALRAAFAEKFKDKIVFSRVSAKDLKKIFKLAGVTTTAALVGAYVDSVTSKYDPQARSMVLKMPYNSPLKDQLPHADERPVILNKESFSDRIAGNNYVPFYLASPCYADLEVRRTIVTCDDYQHDPATGAIFCGVNTNLKSVCIDSISYLEANGRIPFVSLPRESCDGKQEEQLKYIAYCGNELTVPSTTVLEGRVLGQSPKHCIVDAVEITVDKKDRDDNDDNFCFTRASSATPYIFAGTILGEAAIAYFSGGVMTEIIWGVGGGVAATISASVEEWP